MLTFQPRLKPSSKRSV